MKKIISNLIILFYVLIVVIGIIVCIYSMYYYNVDIMKGLGGLFITFVFFSIFIVLPTTINTNRTNLINENFLLDIYNRNSDFEHIRITEKNLLFKYKGTIRFAGILPKFFIYLMITKKELYRTPTFIIKNKNQLTTNETNNVIEKIKELSDTIENEIVINIKGHKRYTSVDKINGIFEKYNIEI